MPDITMCRGTGCPLRERCYRAMAEPDEYQQAYFTETHVNEDGECKYFDSVEEGDTLVTKEQDDG